MYTCNSLCFNPINNWKDKMKLCYQKKINVSGNFATSQQETHTKSQRKH